MRARFSPLTPSALFCRGPLDIKRPAALAAEGDDSVGDLVPGDTAPVGPGAGCDSAVHPMAPRRVLHVSGRMDRAGAETMIMELYRNIDRQRLQFDFVFFTDEKCDYDDEIARLGGRIFRLPAAGTGRVIRRFFALIGLLRRHPEIQIVHSHNLLASAQFVLAAALAGVKIRIAHAHSAIDPSTEGRVQRVYRFISVFALHHLVTAPLSCGAAASRYLFPRRRDVRLLPNGIDLDRFIGPLGDEAERRADTHPQEGAKRLELLQVGRLEPVKNHAFTLQVAQALRQRGVPFRLSLIGRGTLEDELRAGIEALGLADHVVMLGLRTDIPELMRGADVMLMPSHYEGMPLAMVEAQAAGLSCLVSDRISSESDVGLGLVRFLPLKEPALWADSLVALANQPRPSAGERARVLRERGFDVVSNIARLEEIYVRGSGSTI